jgi:hypothetical protein
MKATIKFKLPEDSYEYAIHNLAPDMAGLLWELTHNVKKKCEWAAAQVDPINANIYDGIDIVFDKINELLTEWNIDPDKLG